MTQHYHSGQSKITEADHIAFGWAVISLPFSMSAVVLLLSKLAGSINLSWGWTATLLGILVIIVTLCALCSHYQEQKIKP